MARSGIRWYYNTLTPRMAIFTTVMEEGVGEYMQRQTDDIEEYMKANAPWQDRTGMARDGLTAEYVEEGHKHMIYLYHTVDYGIWLEIRWNGRYAIIEPTVHEYSPAIMRNLTFGELFKE